MGPTDKQLRYLAVLAGQLGERDEWEMFPGMSRSKAQRKASLADATAAIENAKARLVVKERRALLPEGAWDEGAILIDGKWYPLADEPRVALQTLQARGPVDLPALLADRWARKNAGSGAPWADAIAAVVAARPAAEAARLEAIRQIRALMATHGVAASDLADPAQ